MTPQTLQRRIRKHLEAAGIKPDLMDSYGSLLTFRKLVRQEAETTPGKESARLYAWQILETLRGCEVYDYFEGWFKGKKYYVVRFEAPSFLPPLPAASKNGTWSQPKAKPVARVEVQVKPAPIVETAPEIIETEPEPPAVIEELPAPISAEEPEPPVIVEVSASEVKREIEVAGSYLEKQVRPATGQVAWTIVAKKGSDQPKQARCEVVDVLTALPLGGQGECLAEVRLTKTGQKIRVSLEKLFDHVPHQKAGGRWI